jgi:hypothetical protein
MCVAEELSKSIAKVSPLKGAADEIVKSFLDRVGREIKSEDACRHTRKGRVGRKTCRKKTSK